MSDCAWNELETLILVAGHAVYRASDFARPQADESWILDAFQKGEPPLYIEHIRAGISLATDDRASLLVFSGGQTRGEAGARSEAGGYWLIAEHVLHWDSVVRSRSTTEEYARDSFENLLFGICRFFECTARFPRTVRVVSWQFKEARFDLHRTAIRLPRDRYEFVGVNNPDDLAEAERGEQTTIEQFSDDPYGIRRAPPDSAPRDRRKYLGEKRHARDPFHRRPPYTVTCPILAALLTHDSTASFNGDLPW